MIKPKSLILVLVAVIIFEAVIFSINQNKSTQIPPSPCKNLASGEKTKCFEDLMEKTLQTQGLDKTFVLMDNLFQTDPDFAPECHGFAHLLGEKAYLLFASNKDFTLSPKTSYCGYGFYHGFMEKLLQSKGTLTQAQDFCKWAGEKLREQTQDAEGACYHGIGHGAVEDVTDPKLFGNSQAIIQPSLELCEKVSENNQDKLFRCVTGVFNALEIVTTQGKYNLSYDPKDPLKVCRTQPEKYKRACYTQMVVAALVVSNNDFEKTAQVLETIPEDSYASETLSGMVVEFVREGRTDYQQTINFCHKLSNRFQIPCITGFAEGFLKYGPPQQEYVKAVDFCGSPLLKENEKQACFERVLSILRIWYTVEKSRSICQSIDPKYRWNNCYYSQ